MKKLLVLMLVLGIGSFASAGFELGKAADDVATLTGDGLYKAYWISVSGEGTANVEMLYSRPGSGIDDFSSMMEYVAYAESLLGAPVSALYLAAFVDTSNPDDAIAPNGLVLRAQLTSTAPAVLTLHDADTFDVLQSVLLTPEPMSLLMLGLGGLFLRRRK